MSERVDPVRQAMLEIFAEALRAADPREAVARALRPVDGGVRVFSDRVAFSGSVVLVAVGKAAVTMTQGAIDALGASIAGGIAITKDGHAGGARFDRIAIAEASHPIPDERGVRATKRAIEIVDEAGDDDLILALISGGGSALFEAPRPPVTLADMARVTDLLLRVGADITELNRVRTPLSLVKGGGFLGFVGEGPVVTLILSDVLGNDPKVIASGPTVPGERDPAQARAILRKYGVWDETPASIRQLFTNPKIGDDPEAWEGDLVRIVADNLAAINAALGAAEGIGLEPEPVWRDRVGEAREQGSAWAELCLAADDDTDCLIGGGEMTVTVRGDGIGGRNTEFALSAAMRLHELGDSDWVVASLATDGQDGPTGVAGAILDAGDIGRLLADGFDLEDALARNDTLAPILAVGAAVDTGPTGTNVNDLYFAVRRSALS